MRKWVVLSFILLVSAAVAQQNPPGLPANLATVWGVLQQFVVGIQYTAPYSAAGIAIPTCNSGTKGMVAMVSDATTPTYHGTYTSGSTVISPVFCNGSNWLTD